MRGGRFMIAGRAGLDKSSEARHDLAFVVGITVAKKPKLSNGDLAAKLYERLQGITGCPSSLTLAITPSQAHGWTALLSPAQRKRHPTFAQRFDRLVAQFRQEYDLAKD
jgi:hypothetical protein